MQTPPTICILALGIDNDSIPYWLQQFVDDAHTPTTTSSLEYDHFPLGIVRSTPLFFSSDLGASSNEILWSRFSLGEGPLLWPRAVRPLRLRIDDSDESPPPLREPRPIRISLRVEREEECKYYWGLNQQQCPKKRMVEKFSQPRVQKKFIPLHQPRQSSQSSYQKRNQMHFQQQKKQSHKGKK